MSAKHWPPRDAHPFFANLLPEGLAREAECDRLGISPDNDAALLRALGDDTAGAFRFIVDDGEAPQREGRQRLLITEEELDRWAHGEPALPSNPDHLPRLSLAGAQHKVAVVEMGDGYGIPATGEASTHILKFDAHRFPHLTANEFLCMTFAEELGLPIAKIRLDTRTRTPFPVVERYDRHRDQSGAVHRLHQEDFCQAPPGAAIDLDSHCWSQFIIDPDGVEARRRCYGIASLASPCRMSRQIWEGVVKALRVHHISMERRLPEGVVKALRVHHNSMDRRLPACNCEDDEFVATPEVIK